MSSNFDDWQRQAGAMNSAMREFDRIQKLLAPTVADSFLIEEKRRNDILGVLGQAKIRSELSNKNIIDSLGLDSAAVKAALGNDRNSLVEKFNKESLAQDINKFLLPDLFAAKVIGQESLAYLTSGRYAALHDAAAAMHLSIADVVSSSMAVDLPWARPDALLLSASGLTQLNMLAYGLERLDPFTPAMSKLVSFELGSWEQPQPDFHNLLNVRERNEFYLYQGLREELVDFPDDVFDEHMDAAGFPSAPQPITTLHIEVPFEICESEQRAAEVGLWLRALEKHIRMLIENLMSKHYGPKWLKQLPGDLEWAKRQISAEKSRPSTTVVDYADFTDYEKILGKEHKQVFSDVFPDKQDMIISFKRLYAARLAWAHAREVTPADKLIIVSEASRIINAVKISLQNSQ